MKSTTSNNRVPRWHRLSLLKMMSWLVFSLLIGSGIPGSIAQPIPLPGSAGDELSLRDFLEEQKLTADGTDVDSFGHAVTLSADGSTALVSALWDQVGANTDQGSVYVFIWTGTTWSKQKQLVADDGTQGDLFGYSVALSSDGNTALIGASGDDLGTGSHRGSAYIFKRIGTDWVQQTKLISDDNNPFNQFGISAALSADGNRALVGANWSDIATTSDQGAAYIFAWNGSSWTQEAKLVANDGQENDEFGVKVALNAAGNVALIGTDIVSNSAYVFTRSGTDWSQQTKLVGEDTEPGDFFGFSVALSGNGNLALIGSMVDDVTNVNQGSAYIFAWNGTNWLEKEKLTASDGLEQDRFGWSVALSNDGNTALVSAPWVNNYQGAAYIFTWNGSEWIEQPRLTGSDAVSEDYNQMSVSISGNGNTALLGISDHNDDRGAGYVFTRELFTNCAAVTTIPVSECNTLVDFYNNTGGVNWTLKTNWLTDVEPCTWFGVICLGGNVDRLMLFNNGLNGSIPATLGNLVNLTGLNLAGNQLTGDIPAEFANLTNLESGDTTVDYNLLTASNAGVINLLDTVNPSWDETQTIPPTNLIVDATNANGLLISWLPIAYQADNGHYKVNCDSPTLAVETYTTNKSGSEVLISGLPAGVYTCTVRTFTPVHANNSNELISAPVAAAPVAYEGQDVPPNDRFDKPIVLESFLVPNYSLNIDNATRDDDPTPPANDPGCPVSLPSTGAGIHYEIPGNLSTGGIVMNVGGPVWYGNRRASPREAGVADTAIVIYEADGDGFGDVIVCDDDNAPGEVSVSSVKFDLDPGKTYRAVVWNEAPAPEGAIIEIAPASFDLAAPLDDSAALEAPASFTWLAYEGAIHYHFKVARTSEEPLSKFILVELKPAADDDDSLTCDGGLCTLNVVPGSDLANYLSDGNYLWSVSASMSATDTNLPTVNSNQIFRFIVGELPIVNLLVNGNFETDNDFNKQPDGWTGKTLTGDKIKCNKPDKLTAYEGVCAYFFKGSALENAAISQNVDGDALSVGQDLTLNVRVLGSGIVTATKAVVNIRYENGGGTKEKIGFTLGAIDEYTLFSSLPVEITSAVSSIKVTVKSKRLTGKLFVDDLQLTTTVSSAVSSAGHDPLPLPPASGLTGSGQ